MPLQEAGVPRAGAGVEGWLSPSGEPSPVCSLPPEASLAGGPACVHSSGFSSSAVKNKDLVPFIPQFDFSFFAAAAESADQ